MPHMLSYSNTQLATVPCLQRHILPSVNTLSLLRQSHYRVTASLQDVLPNCEESEQPVASLSLTVRFQINTNIIPDSHAALESVRPNPFI